MRRLSRPCTRRCRARTIPSSICAAAGHQADAAPLRLFEDLRGLQQRLQLLHHPALRGRLASRPIDEVLREAERLVAAGVQELLVISQDTSAYGLDLGYAKSAWRGEEREARFIGSPKRSAASAPGCGCTTSTPTPMSMR